MFFTLFNANPKASIENFSFSTNRKILSVYQIGNNSFSGKPFNFDSFSNEFN